MHFNLDYFARRILRITRSIGLKYRIMREYFAVHLSLLHFAARKDYNRRGEKLCIALWLSCITPL